MVGALNIFAWGGFSGGGIGNLLNKWGDAGVFSYVLPFLLLFALIFAIIGKIKVFGENKGVNVLVALVVALMALQFDFVSKFFSEIFPRLGVGLAIILVILILLGMFIDPDKSWVMITFLIIGVIIVIVILLNTAGAIGWNTGYWWRDNWDNIAIAVVVLGLVFWIIGGGKRNSPSQPSTWKALGFKE